MKLAAASCKLFSILQTPLHRIFLIVSIGRRPAFRIAIPLQMRALSRALWGHVTFIEQPLTYPMLLQRSTRDPTIHEGGYVIF